MNFVEKQKKIKKRFGNKRILLKCFSKFLTNIKLRSTFAFWSNNFRYSSSKKKRNTPIYFNANYRREMKLVPIIMDYCLL